jgi:hypothetical protein
MSTLWHNANLHYWSKLHYTPHHTTPLHYPTLYYTTLHYTTLHYITHTHTHTHKIQKPCTTYHPNTAMCVHTYTWVTNLHSNHYTLSFTTHYTDCDTDFMQVSSIVFCTLTTESFQIQEMKALPISKAKCYWCNEKNCSCRIKCKLSKR